MHIIKRIANNNSIWAVIFFAVKTICNFFLVPILVRKIGMDQYGYIALANNFLLYIDLICVAFNYFAVRNIAVAYHTNELRKATMYYSTIVWADLFLCVALGIPSLTVIYFSDRIIFISDAYCRDVKLLFLFILIKYFIMLIGSILDVAVFIKNRLDISSKNRTISYLLYVVSILLLLKRFEPKIWFIGVAALLESVVYFGGQLWIKRISMPYLKPRLTSFSFKGICNYLESGIWIAFNNLGNVLNDGLDLMITNLMISEKMVGMISIAKMLGNMIYSIIVAISNSLRPKQLEDYSNGSLNSLVDRLRRTMRLTSICYGVFLGEFIGCGEAFLRIWLKGNDISSIYRLSILAILAYFIPANVSPLYYVFTLTKKIRFPSYITIIMGITNVITMIVLLKYSALGGAAVLLSTAILNLVHIIDTPLYAAHCLGISRKTFYKPLIEHVIVCICCYVVGSIYSVMMGNIVNWIELILAAGLFLAIAVCLFATVTLVIRMLYYLAPKKEV